MLLDLHPVAALRSWASFVKQPETEEELQSLRRGVGQGSPYGEATGRSAPPSA